MISVRPRVILPRMTRTDSGGSRVAVLGAGTVGGALLRRRENETALTVSSELVRDGSRARQLAPQQQQVLTTDPTEALSGAELLVEMLAGTALAVDRMLVAPGRTGLAVDLMLEAVGRGIPVVTGNKAALAERWDLFLPHMRRGLLHFEAAVMAGTPVIAPLTAVLRGSEPLGLDAILNGTCSYIIRRLADGEGFEAALAAAQELGYAEADPTFDIEGIDAAHKLTILGRLAFDPELEFTAVREQTRGITALTPELVREHAAAGRRAALVGSIRPGAQGWQAGVRPVALPADHPLARIDPAHNGCLFRGRHSGDVLISGPGAGGDETASAVLADLLNAAAGRPGPAPLLRARPLPEPGDAAMTSEPVVLA